MDEREAGELMHRSVHSVLHITVLLGVLHEGLEGGDYVLGVLRSGEVVGMDDLDRFILDIVDVDRRHDIQVLTW